MSREPDAVLARPTRPAARAPQRAARVPFALVVVALVVGGMSALLALNTASAANELRRHDLALRDATAAMQVQQLQNEVAAASAPGALAAAATQLGMVPVTNPAFLVIGADGRVRVLGNPAPAVYVPPLPTMPLATAPGTKPAATPKPVKPARKPARPAATTTTTTAGAPPAARPPSASPTRPSPAPSSAAATTTTTLPGGPR